MHTRTPRDALHIHNLFRTANTPLDDVYAYYASLRSSRTQYTRTQAFKLARIRRLTGRFHRDGSNRAGRIAVTCKYTRKIISAVSAVIAVIRFERDTYSAVDIF